MFSFDHRQSRIKWTRDLFPQRNPAKYLVQLIFPGVLAVSCLTSLYAVRVMSFSQAHVENSSDSNAFSSRELPGFIHQHNSRRLFRFGIYVSAQTEKYADTLKRAVAVRKWVRDQQSDKPEAWQKPYLDDSEDPEQLLREQRAGFHSACRRFSYILAGSLLSVGLDARVVSLAEDFSDSARSHTLVEVWIAGAQQMGAA